MTRPLDCAAVVRRLWDFLDAALEEADEAALEAHLAFCMRCCGELAFARELRAVLRTRSSAAMPDDARERLERIIDDLGDPIDEGLS